MTLIALGATALSAQQTPVASLAPANGTLTDAFHTESLNQTLAFPRQLHELSDGRVLLMDGSRVVVADFSTGKIEVKPELKTGGLLSLAGDSSVITTSNGWYFLNGLTAVGMLPRENPVVASGSTVRGADDNGHVLVEPPRTKAGESTTVVLVDRASGDRHPVTQLAAAIAVDRMAFRPVCQMNEQALLTSDGWIAVLRANPYRVDWRKPDGAWVLGPPIPDATVPMTQRERDVYLAWRERERPTQPRDTVRVWPENVCPWIGGYPPIATPDGKLVVYRVPTSEAPATRYDVIDRQGRLERQIAMPSSDAILGFGQHSVYVIRTNPENQTISRHPWP